MWPFFLFIQTHTCPFEYKLMRAQKRIDVTSLLYLSMYEQLRFTVPNERLENKMPTKKLKNFQYLILSLKTIGITHE